MEAWQAFRLHYPKSLDYAIRCIKGVSKLFFSFFDASACFFVGRFQSVEFVDSGQDVFPKCLRICHFSFLHLSAAFLSKYRLTQSV